MDGSLSPMKRRASPEDDEMADRQLMRTSVSNLAAGGNGVVAMVMHSSEEWRRSNVPLEERWNRAISVIRYYTGIRDRATMMVALSETILQGQRKLNCNQLTIGLAPLKEWVDGHLHRVIVPPTNPDMLRISTNTPYNSFCVIISQPQCGVRSYLTNVCKELRIDLYTVGPTYYETGMMEDLLKEARQSGRSMILFDRVGWFSSSEYGARGADFMHQIRAAMMQQKASREREQLESGNMLTMRNDMKSDTLSSLLPGLWIVVSTASSDVHHDVVPLANGSMIRVHNASRDLSMQAIRICLETKFSAYGFSKTMIDNAFETTYHETFTRIAILLEKAEFGFIVGVIECALQFVIQRDRHSATSGLDMLKLLPTEADVRLAYSQLSGNVMGGAGTHTNTASVAASMASQLNGLAQRRT